MKTNTEWVLYHYVKELNIPVTASSIDNELQIHPLHYSLLGMSDVLDSLNITHGTYQLTFEELILEQLTTPFIASFKHNEFVLITHLSDEYVIFSNEKNENTKMASHLFKDLYSGAILLAENDEGSREANYLKKRVIEIFRKRSISLGIAGILLAAIFLIVGFSSYLNNIDSQIIILLILKTIGLGISILLLIQSINAKNPIIKKICGVDNNKSCNAILSSKAASINGWISWSEIGFFYFAGSFIALLFNGKNLELIQVMAWFNLLSLPYTIYSIYYQWRIAKQWCILCCSIQALLWLEFFLFLPYLPNTTIPAFDTWLITLILFLIPVSIWLIIKPLASEMQANTVLKKHLRTFKYNYDVFQKMMNEQTQHQLLSEEHTIVVGNAEAKNVITVISNPYCHHCADVHKSIEIWMENEKNVKLQVVFKTPNANDIITFAASHMLALKKKHDIQTIRKAVNDWYERKFVDYKGWAKAYPVNTDLGPNENLKIQALWVNSTQTIGTPHVFINGRKLPHSYEVKDLKYFL